MKSVWSSLPNEPIRFGQMATGPRGLSPDDCGGPPGYLAQREARFSMDALNDLGVMTRLIEKVALEELRTPVFARCLKSL